MMADSRRWWRHRHFSTDHISIVIVVIFEVVIVIGGIGRFAFA